MRLSVLNVISLFVIVVVSNQSFSSESSFTLVSSLLSGMLKILAMHAGAAGIIF